VIFAAVYGFASGAPLILNALLAGDYLGMKNFGAIYGLLNITANLAGSLGPAGAGFFHQAYKTYLPVFYLFVVLMVIGAVISARIKPPPGRQPVSP